MFNRISQNSMNTPLNLPLLGETISYFFINQTQVERVNRICWSFLYGYVNPNLFYENANLSQASILYITFAILKTIDYESNDYNNLRVTRCFQIRKRS